MKRLFVIIFLCAAAVGGWYLWQQQGSIELPLKNVNIPFFEQESSILTFEALTTADEIMQKNQKSLLKDANHTFGAATVQFLPFLLLDVKYTKEDKKTEEGRLLWSLENGELVLDTATFESTCGFSDFIRAKAKDEDFRILMILMRHGGSATKDAIIEESGIDPDFVFQRLDALRARHLIAVSGETVRIHLSNPHFKVHPVTKISHHIVTKKVSSATKLPQQFSRGDILHVARAAFGADFAIRSETLIYVPIFLIEVKNPDGSVYKTFWNGITGKELNYNLASTL